MNIFDILIVQPIFNLLVALYAIIPGGDFGVAIIIFTVLVRFALYPLTRSQLHHTRAMRKLQPELARIRKRAGKNRQQAAMQQMELYKKEGISMFRPLGLAFVQLPIFFALFFVIQKFTQHRDQIAEFTYNFLEGLEPVKKLVEDPDSFNQTFLGFLDLTKHAFHDGKVEIFLILLAVVAAVTQYIMSKQTMPHNKNQKRLRDIMAEASDGNQHDQAEMNAAVMEKMVKVLPIMMFFVMINFPGAIALYYAVSNIVGASLQSYLLKQDEEELEDISEETPKKSGKKATAKAREKVAKEAGVVRITAKDEKRRK